MSRREKKRKERRRRVQLTVYSQGDPTDKAVTTNAKWLLSAIDGKGCGIHFRPGCSVDYMSEVFFTLGKLFHQYAGSPTGQKKIRRLYSICIGKAVAKDWSPEELIESRRLIREIGAGMPCDNPFCRYCSPGGLHPQEN